MANKRHPNDPPQELTAEEKTALQQSTEVALSAALDVLEDERREFDAAIRKAVFEKRPDLKNETLPTLELVQLALSQTSTQPCEGLDIIMALVNGDGFKKAAVEFLSENKSEGDFSVALNRLGNKLAVDAVRRKSTERA